MILLYLYVILFPLLSDILEPFIGFYTSDAKINKPLHTDKCFVIETFAHPQYVVGDADTVGKYKLSIVSMYFFIHA